MKPIVSDAGPLISFARAGSLGLLQRVVQRLLVPEAVYGEVVVRGADRLSRAPQKKAHSNQEFELG
jgi:predicted nucleic acid-binding protein